MVIGGTRKNRTIKNRVGASRTEFPGIASFRLNIYARVRIAVPLHVVAKTRPSARRSSTVGTFTGQFAIPLLPTISRALYVG